MDKEKKFSPSRSMFSFPGKSSAAFSVRKKFTLIELVVSVTCQIGVLPLYCLKKIHKNSTSLRPSGRTSRFFCDLAGNGNRKKNSSHLHIFTQSAFTLIELVVVLAIIVISLGFAVAAFRGDSAARQLERASTGFETFCARARFQAQEHGEDIIVCFSPVTKEFLTKRNLTEEELAAEERKRQELTDEDDPMPDPPSVIKWKLPENTRINEESFAAEDAPDDNMYEVFRFFPDGGASGTRRFKLQCKALSLTYDISPLTGLLITVKEEE